MNRFKEYPKTITDLYFCYRIWINKEIPLRFGQYMYNYYADYNIPWPELFYCENINESFEICLEEIRKINFSWHSNKKKVYLNWKLRKINFPWHSNKKKVYLNWKLRKISY